MQVIGRDIEESLNLAGMQFQRQNAVCARRRNHVGDQLRGNRRASARLAVLARIAEVRQHGGDTAGRPAFQRVDGNKQLHQIVVCRIRCRLNDEHILAAHIVHDLDEHFHVGETADRCLGQGDVQIGGNSFGQGAV